MLSERGRFPSFASDVFTCPEERRTCGTVVSFLFYPSNDWLGGMVGGSVLCLPERGNLTKDYSFVRHSWLR